MALRYALSSVDKYYYLKLIIKLSKTIRSNLIDPFSVELFEYILLFSHRKPPTETVHVRKFPKSFNFKRIFTAHCEMSPFHF